jgi:hypothetical protein
MTDWYPKSNTIEKDLRPIRSCKTCVHTDLSPNQPCDDCCQLSNWQPNDSPSPHARDGYSDQGDCLFHTIYPDGFIQGEGACPVPSDPCREYWERLKR